MIRRFLCWFVVVLLVLLGGCFSPTNEEEGSLSQSVIYDKDDRVYTDDHPDAKLRSLADSVAMFVSYRYVIRDKQSNAVTLKSSSLTDKVQNSSSYNKKPLCQSEPFRMDPAPGSCTGFLIGPKLLATAGHCVSQTTNITIQTAQSWCNYKAFIFGFKKGRALTDDDVYRCSRVLVHGYSSTPKLDYALIELDREVKGLVPLAYAPKPVFKKNEPIALIGYPHGTWQKIAGGAVVSDARASKWDYFVTTLDSMPGNSGSPVFSLDSYKVVGIHVRGARPVYDVDKQKDCNVSHKITDGKGRQSESYMDKILGSTCQTDANCSARQFCEKGFCILRNMELEMTDYHLSASTGSVGAQIQATVSFKNAGNYDIYQDFRIGIWWSTNDTLCATCGKDQLLASVLIRGGLKIGASLTKVLSFTINAPFVKGKQYIGVALDDYLTASKKASYYGMVAERREDNNKKVLPFVVDGCKAGCFKEGESRCTGRDVEVCRLDLKGCLGWEKKESCGRTFTCEKGACVIQCKDQCAFDEANRCQGTNVEKCAKAVTGCYEWTQSESCETGQTCKAGKCVQMQKEEAETCLSNEQCKSSLCVALSTAKKICSRACTQHGDCRGLQGLGYCAKGFCQRLPEGACLASSDCASGEVCRDDTCQPASAPDAGVTERQAVDSLKPPNGCGCSSQSLSANEREGHGVLVFLSLLWVGFVSRRSKGK